MRAEIYAALVERVGGALDYDVRWQPNEYEPDGFVERVCPLELTNGVLVASGCPLELTNGVLVASGCPQCGAQILANRVEVAFPCGLAGSFI